MLAVAPDRLTRIFRTRTRDEWAETFAGTDARVTPVLTPWEAPDHPANADRGTFVEVGGIVQPAPAPRFSRTPAGTPVPADHSGRNVLATLTDWWFELEDAGALVESAVVRLTAGRVGPRAAALSRWVCATTRAASTTTPPAACHRVSR